jgi:hypothetical protein
MNRLVPFMERFDGDNTTVESDFGLARNGISSWAFLRIFDSLLEAYSSLEKKAVKLQNVESTIANFH